MPDPTERLKPPYVIENIRVLEGRIVIDFYEPPAVTSPIQDATSRVIPFGVDEDLDALLTQLLEEAMQLIDESARVKRNPPDRIPL